MSNRGPLSELDANAVDRNVPASCVLATRQGQWPGADLRVYDFHARQTRLEPLRDVVVIGYHTAASIGLRCGAIAGEAVMKPWDFSVLTPGAESRWEWASAFRTTVVFLSLERLNNLAERVFERDIESIEIRESLQTQDPVFQSAVSALSSELRSTAPGGELYADSVLTQLGIHVLRNHATPRLRLPRVAGALSVPQARRVVEYIEANLASDLSLDALASVAGMSLFHFARLFRKRFGVTPHAYVLDRRLSRAHEMLENSDCALKEIVGACGFYDQSHLAKSFKRSFGTNPTEIRRLRRHD